MRATAFASLEGSGERGQMTLLGLGMVVVMVFVGGMGLDLARVYSERRALTEMADAAAAAGANGIDVASYRSDGELRLDPALARELMRGNLASQADDRSVAGVAVDADESSVIVEVRGTVPLTLLGLFTLGEPFELVVRAEAGPRRSRPS